MIKRDHSPLETQEETEGMAKMDSLRCSPRPYLFNKAVVLYSELKKKTVTDYNRHSLVGFLVLSNLQVVLS